VSRSVVLVIVAAVLWGTTGTAAFFLGPDVSPLAIGAATMGIGGVVLAILGGRQSRAVLADPGVRSWVLLGIAGVIVYPLTFYWGMSLAGIALGNVIALGLGPITVAALEWLVDRSRPTAVWWWSSGLALTGIAIMSTAKVELGGGRPGNVSMGVALAVVAGLAYGLYTYSFGRLIDRGHTPLAVIGAVFGGGAPVLLVVLGVTGAGLAVSALQGGLVGYLVLGPMVLAYVAFSAALRTLRSSTVASVALVEPVVAAVLAVVVVGERLGPLAVVGGVAVVVAIGLLGRASGERPGTERTYS
jgi:drug/metabolite transporter, DME family